MATRPLALAAALLLMLLASPARGYIRDGEEPAQHAARRRPARRLFNNDGTLLNVIVRWRDGVSVGVDSATEFLAPVLTFETANVSQVKLWRASGLVESIEVDSVVRATQVVDAPPLLAQVDPPSWGLDRIDQRDLPLDGRYMFRGDGSSGVQVFLVDSGLRASHTQVTGRVLPGRNFNTADASAEDTSDCGSGHGSHLAGIVAGTTVGVAKGVHVCPARVYGCAMEGPLSQVLQGLAWVAQAARAARSEGRRSVVNLSFGTDRSPAMDAAVRGLVNAGVVVVAAAGNEARDACGVSPAGEPAVLTVASADPDDALSTFSNRGPCVDLVAPGKSIVSVGIASDTAGSVMSGTSMAAPFAAGAAALYLQAYPQATPAQVVDFLTCAATRNVLSGDLAGTPNRLLYLDALDAGGFPAPGTPCAAMGQQPSPTSPGAPPAGATCPRGCSGNGACSAAGRCACTCNAVGVDCSVVLPVTELEGLSGSVRGSTLDARSSFGDPSPDAYFALTVPDDATAVSLSTCNPGTDFDTTLFLLRRCFTGADLSSLGVAAESDDDPRFGDRRCSTVRLVAPPPGRYYALLEGFVDTRGGYELSYTIESRSGRAATPTPSRGHVSVQARSSAPGGGQRAAASEGAAIAAVGTAFALGILAHVWGPGLL